MDKEILSKWLSAGYIDQGVLHQTEFDKTIAVAPDLMFLYGVAEVNAPLFVSIDCEHVVLA